MNIFPDNAAPNDFFRGTRVNAAIVGVNTGFDLCTFGGSPPNGPAGFCQRLEAVPDGTFQIVAQNTVSGTTARMVIEITVSGGGTLFDLTSATVTITNGAAGPTAQDKSNITAALQNSLNSVTPGLLSGGLPLNGTGGNGNGVTFSPTGLGFARSSINSANPMDRDYGAAFAPQGYFARGDTRQRGNGFNFSVDLQQMLASNSAAAGQTNLASSSAKRGRPGENALAYGDSGAKDGPTRPRSRFNSWVTGKYVDFDDGETNADRDGSLWVVTSGLSVQMGANTNVGVISRYRQGDVDSTALSASLDSEAYGGGAYLTTTLGGGLNVALAALYEMGDNDIVISGARGDFDSEQFTLEGKIDKRITRGAMWIQPALSLLYLDTAQDNYTDSAGTVVAGQDLTLGRLAYGPTVGTTIQRGNTQIRPFAKINGIWDFENEGSFTTTTAGTFVTGDNALNLGAGVEIVYVSGFAIKLSGDWFSFDSDLEAWAISGGIGAPLSAFGIGTAGTLSLDLTSNALDASATARLRIPLGKTP